MEIEKPNSEQGNKGLHPSIIHLLSEKVVMSFSVLCLLHLSNFGHLI